MDLDALLRSCPREGLPLTPDLPSQIGCVCSMQRYLNRRRCNLHPAAGAGRC
jgi:hypothetical protein